MKINTFQAKLDSYKSEEENKFVEDNVEPKQALVTWNYLPDEISNIRGVRGDESVFFWPDGSPWDYNNFINRNKRMYSFLKRMYILLHTNTCRLMYYDIFLLGKPSMCVFMWNPKWDENSCEFKKHLFCKKPSRHGGTLLYNI